tara:strand:- start:766 stop:1356 length:591 start_codon:yes stop_codon:yes gene_type:complete
MKYLPNILTSLRLSSPIFFIITILIFENLAMQTLILFYIFVLLSISDYLDGYLARRLSITSNYGKVFDPISDKILTSSALLFLSSINSKIVIPSILIIFREFLISGTREFSLITNRTNINVSYLSKIKTTLQFFIISSLFILFSFKNKLLLNQSINIEKLVNFCIYGLWIVTLLTLYTGYQYCNNIYFNKRKGKVK